MEKRKAQNVYLIDNWKKIKPKHLNKKRLHLEKNSLPMLGNIFTRGISKTVN